MRIETINESSDAPILLEEVKEHLRIDGEQQDSNISSLIAASVKSMESFTDLVLMERQVNLFYDDGSPAANENGWWNGVADGIVPTSTGTFSVPISIRPVRSIETVAVQSSGGTEEVLAASEYVFKPGFRPSLSIKRSIPTVGSVRIAATVGFGASWNDVPADIRQALLLLVTAFYTERGDKGQNTMSMIKRCGAEALLLPYRRVRV